jgi:hypothetical protein
MDSRTDTGVQQSVVFQRLKEQDDHNQPPSSMYVTLFVGKRTVYNARELWMSVFPRYQKDINTIHEDMIVRSSQLEEFIQRFHPYNMLAVNSELLAVTSGIDADTQYNVMAYVRQHKTSRIVLWKIREVNKNMWNHYHSIIDNLIYRFALDRLHQYEKEVFDRAMLALEEQSKQNSNIRSPFEHPDSLQWKPRTHHLFTANTHQSIMYLLMGLKKLPSMPKLDPMVLEEAFLGLRLKDDYSEHPEEDDYSEEEQDEFDELDYAPEPCEFCCSYTCNGYACNSDGY